MVAISRGRVHNLMQRRGLRAIYQKPLTTTPGLPSERFPWLVQLGKITAVHQVLGHGNHLHPATQGVSVSGGDHGHVLQGRSQREDFQQLGYAILHGRVGDDFGQW